MMAGSESNAPAPVPLPMIRMLLGNHDQQGIIEELRRQPNVQVRELEDGGAIIVIKPNPRDFTILFVLTVAVSALLALLALAMDLNWFGLEFRIQTLKLYIFAGVGGMFALMGVLVRAAAGPPKESTIEVHQGRMKVDFYVSGDHVVKEIRAEEIQAIDDTAGLDFYLRHTTFSIAQFSPSKTVKLLGQLISVILWRP
jgi:hypothetical protein